MTNGTISWRRTENRLTCTELNGVSDYHSPPSVYSFTHRMAEIVGWNLRIPLDEEALCLRPNTPWTGLWTIYNSYGLDALLCGLFTEIRRNNRKEVFNFGMDRISSIAHWEYQHFPLSLSYQTLRYLVDCNSTPFPTPIPGSIWNSGDSQPYLATVLVAC